MKNGTRERGRERKGKLLPLQWQLWQRWRAFDGGPSVYLCDVKLGIWGSFIHESTSLMLTGWLRCLYCLPQASVVVKLLLNNFFYSQMFQVYLIAEEKVSFICLLFSLTVLCVLLLFHQKLNHWTLVLLPNRHTLILQESLMTQMEIIISAVRGGQCEEIILYWDMRLYFIIDTGSYWILHCYIHIRYGINVVVFLFFLLILKIEVQ